uniref:CCHC-type domain-containing protein n=1 Tax=Ananas comosus var. bracteatus TaxID=296719 RepID=A0A6V7QSV4_ANACO
MSLPRERFEGSPRELRRKVTGRGEGGSTNCSTLNRGSFKDVLLRRSSLTPPAPYLLQPHLHAPPPLGSTRGRTPPRRSVKRCFRCLASDHFVATCRDPVRCFRCGKTGHRAHFCKGKSCANARTMNRAANLRDRAPVAKVFVPYTDEYLRRVELRRNAILADVIQPANLGPNPISTIKTTLASRFRGYKEDFAVARCRERDFAIFLPEWVPAAILIRRQVLTLNDFWIRSRVAALINGFGRFIKADDETKAMTNFRAFRCQIALDSIYNIPQNLSVIIGEELFPVMVHLRGGNEQWKAEPRHHQHLHATAWQCRGRSRRPKPTSA